jgi:hypothetical protein
LLVVVEASVHDRYEEQLTTDTTDRVEIKK